jgi:hypothetical protein
MYERLVAQYQVEERMRLWESDEFVRLTGLVQSADGRRQLALRIERRAHDIAKRRAAKALSKQLDL